MFNYFCIKQPVKGYPDDMMLRCHEISLNEDNEFIPRSAMHVYVRNAEASRWNQKMLNTPDGVVYCCDSRCERGHHANMAVVPNLDNP